MPFAFIVTFPNEGEFTREAVRLSPSSSVSLDRRDELPVDVCETEPE